MFNDDSFLSVSFRGKNGEIKNKIVKIDSKIKKYQFLNYLLIIRGLINFFEGSINQFIASNLIYKNKKNVELKKYLAFFSVIAILLGGFFLYFLIPTLISFYLKRYDLNFNILYGIEVFARLILFLLVFSLISLTKNTKKTAFFHGAEHKTILCYYAGDRVNFENVKKYSIYNPACGTSFIFLLLVLSIPVFYFLNYDNVILRLAIMLIVLPFLIGLSFDILCWYGKKSIKKTMKISSKTFILQRLNTKEPKEEHIKISINAITNLLNLYKTKD
jgi:uncharacterized protein YqhQ